MAAATARARSGFMARTLRLDRGRAPDARSRDDPWDSREAIGDASTGAKQLVVGAAGRSRDRSVDPCRPMARAESSPTVPSVAFLVDWEKTHEVMQFYV